MHFINCTGGQTKGCVVFETTHTIEIILHIATCIASIGTLLNLLSLFIFIFSNNMNTKFLTYLKWYLLNSVIVTINQIVLGTFFALGDMPWYRNENYFMINNYEFVFVFSYVSIPLWNISYTGGTLLDICIAYERILMYLPKVKFMRNVKIYMILIVIVSVSLIFNVPSILLREIGFSVLSFNVTHGPNSTVVFKTYYFLYNRTDFMIICYYVSIVFRDIVTVIIEMVVTVILVITIIKFYNRKRRVVSIKDVNMAEDTNSEPIIFRETDLNNSKITLFICIFSFLNHIIVFMSRISTLYFELNVTVTLIFISMLLFLIKQSCNFFIFLKLNKKFKRNFIILIPKCLKVKSNSKSNKMKAIKSKLPKDNAIISLDTNPKEPNKVQNELEIIDAYDFSIFTVSNQSERLRKNNASVESARQICKETDNQIAKVIHIDNILFETYL